MAYVLIVDSQAEFRDQLVRLLEQAGHCATAVATIAEATRLFEAAVPDLLATDGVLIDGSSASLVHQAEAAGTKTLMMTGNPDRIVELDRAGQPYLSKPFAPEAFLKRVQRDVWRRLIFRYPFRPSPPAEPQQRNSPLLLGFLGPPRRNTIRHSSRNGAVPQRRSAVDELAPGRLSMEHIRNIETRNAAPLRGADRGSWAGRLREGRLRRLPPCRAADAGGAAQGRDWPERRRCSISKGGSGAAGAGGRGGRWSRSSGGRSVPERGSAAARAKHATSTGPAY